MKNIEKPFKNNEISIKNWQKYEKNEENWSKITKKSWKKKKIVGNYFKMGKKLTKMG